MITILKIGKYKLVETKENTKLLYLDDKAYAWIMPKKVGEILVVTRREYQFDTVLSVGRYCLYGVKDEPKLTDLEHLELQVGEHEWQGYLLPTGIPSGEKTKSRIITTNQTITANPLYRGKLLVRPNFLTKTAKTHTT